MTIPSLRDRIHRINAFDGNLVFGAKTFHKETLRTGTNRPGSGGPVAEQRKVLEDVDPRTGCYARIERFWEDVERCPVCNSPNSGFFAERYGVRVLKCLECSHGYSNPRIKEDVSNQLYSSDVTSAATYLTDLQQSLDKKKFQYGLDLLSSFTGNNKGRILDIGCGAGVFLRVAHEDGWEECVGVDLNQSYSDTYSHQPGLQYINGNFYSLPKSLGVQKYDCITLWSVLEHLYHLEQLVTNIKLLSSNLIMVLVPNFRSLSTSILREKSTVINWKHVSYFTPESLRYFFEKKHRFHCLHIETVITEIDNVKSCLSGYDPYSGHGDPDQLYDFITPEVIYSNLLGSRILGIFSTK